MTLVQDLVDETLVVSKNEISQEIRYVFETQKLILKGGAAVGTAALLEKSLRFKD